MNKDTLRTEVIKALKKKLGKNKKPDVDVLLEKMNATVMSKLFTHISPDVLRGVMKDVLLDYAKENKDQFPVKVDATFAEKPEWYKEPSDEVIVKELPEIEIKNVVRVKSDITDIAELAASFFKGLVDFFTKLAKNTFKVMLAKEHYTTPQMMVLVDPHKNFKPIRIEDIGLGTMQNMINIGGGFGAASVKTSNAIQDGFETVVTAGTRVQLANTRCARVFIQAAPTNSGEMVVGGANVVASAVGRRGLALQSSQWQEFQIDNLNRLYIDGTVSGDKINYIYEYVATT